MYMEFDYSNLKNPLYFAENRVDAHSDHRYFANEQELLKGKSSYYHSLNGYWKFHHAINEASTIPGFEKLDYDCHPWQTIAVPAHIQMEGYGVPQYTNTQYPWDGWEAIEPGEIPTEFNPVASYVKYFFLPERMKGMRIYISFQGVESCIALWLNGHYIGFAGDTFTPSEFELTGYLVEGENKLAAKVVRWSAGSWLEDQDFYRFSGIFRDVFLYATPAVHLRDLRVRTLLDDGYQDAQLELVGEMNENRPFSVKVLLREGQSVLHSWTCQGTEGFCLNETISNPKKWSAEVPNLYDLDFYFYDQEGICTEIVRQRVGFRRFEMKDGLMCINGKRIVFNGANRHDFCAETGRAVTEREIRRDLINMKRNNINAIRTSHYPNSSHLYQYADEYGLYVIDENNMESHGIWDQIRQGTKPQSFAIPGDREEYEPMMLDRVNSIYQRDKNHPCILIWSCGNESYGGSVIYHMSEKFRQLDPTRLVHYEGINWDRRYPGTSDMESQMYTPVAGIRAFLAEHPEKPFICCEYTHSMGNSNGAMHKYTDYAEEEPRYQGGFIWDYIDQAIATCNRYGQPYLAYGGDLGDRPNDGNFSGNGIVFADGAVTPKMQEVKFNYQGLRITVDKDNIHIKNKNLFVSTANYDCVVTLARNGHPLRQVPLYTDVPPLSEADYPVPFQEETGRGEYAITVSFRLKEAAPWAPAGHEVAFGQGVYRVDYGVRTKPAVPLKVVEGVHNLGIKGDDFHILFDHAAGGMTSYRYGGVEMIQSLPKPNFWRAITDNDRGNLLFARRAQWKIASLYATSRGPGMADRGLEYLPIVERGEDTVSVSYQFYLPTTPRAAVLMNYTVHADGLVDCKLIYHPVEGLEDMPEFGVMLKMSADFSNLEWYGNGPEENYIDRNRGARLGIFRNKVMDNFTPYLRPQECGNKTGVRWAKVTDDKGRGLIFYGDQMEFSALPWTPHQLENAAHPHELPPVHYTVVRAAMQQMGVAGDDSWGAETHPEYLLDVSKNMEFTFHFKGIIRETAFSAI